MADADILIIQMPISRSRNRLLSKNEQFNDNVSPFVSVSVINTKETTQDSHCITTRTPRFIRAYKLGAAEYQNPQSTFLCRLCSTTQTSTSCSYLARFA